MKIQKTFYNSFVIDLDDFSYSESSAVHKHRKQRLNLNCTYCKCTVNSVLTYVSELYTQLPTIYTTYYLLKKVFFSGAIIKQPSTIATKMITLLEQWGAGFILLRLGRGVNGRCSSYLFLR